MQNTWRIQYYIGRMSIRKLTAVLFVPFVGFIIETNRGDLSKRKPWSLRQLVMRYHIIYKQFFFLWHISVVPSQVFPKVLQEENRPLKRHWCILRPGPLGSKLRYHRVYRNLIQTSIIRVLPACPHSCHLQKMEGKTSMNKFQPGFTYWIFTLAMFGVQNCGLTCWPSEGFFFFLFRFFHLFL